MWSCFVGTTTLWTYDDAGNILRREVYPYTAGTPNVANRTEDVAYTYTNTQWGDLLTAYNGVAITYDNVGNPLNDGTWTYTWQHGRQLASMAKSDITWQYGYNVDGLRIRRTGGDKDYRYTYLGDQLTRMTVDGHTLTFTYNASGAPISLTYDGTDYYYITNLQGDIVTILDNTGTQVVRYTYNAWGNLISTTGDAANTVGLYNPLRYRGYVYDVETELYYLQSRYYNPEMGRFINADGLLTTGQGFLGNNMFAYCGNNPVRNKDSAGNRYIDALSVAAESVDARKQMCQLQNAMVLGKVNASTPCMPASNGSGSGNVVPDKLKQVTESIWNNLEFSAGIGMGFYTEGEVLDTVGLQVGMYGNNFVLHLEDGSFRGGQDYFVGGSASAVTMNLGITEYVFNQNGKPVFTDISKGIYQDETFTIASGAFYVGIGGSFRIGFDTVQFCYDMWDIF